MKKLFNILAVALMLGCFTNLHAQDAQIIIDPVSPWDIIQGNVDTTRFKVPSTGLSVVGVGQMVYLRAVPDTQGTTFAWTTDFPQGSNAMLENTDEFFTGFRPDMEGDFDVTLTINGGPQATVTIKSTKFVGLGIIDDVVASPTSTNCSPCHNGTIEEFIETGHSDMFKRGIDGIASDHYNESCYDCHVVGYNEDPADTLSGGFYDLAVENDWTFPTPAAGEWDNLVSNYPDMAAMANIQCENCHGPAGMHKSGFQADDMAISLDEGVCGRCHEDGHYHRRNTQWQSSGHSSDANEYAAGRSGCADCHSSWGFIALVDPASDLDKKVGDSKISCAVCHDPHADWGMLDGEPTHQVRILDDVTLLNGTVVTSGGMGKICYNCHKGRRDAEEYAQQYSSHFGPHHSNQTDMLYGENAITFGMKLPNSTHYSALGHTCVSCHMYATPEEGMDGHDVMGDHTFAMSYIDDNGTPDNFDDDFKVDNVEACTRCHGEIEEFHDIMARNDYDKDGTIESASDELSGLMDSVGVLLPPLGDPEVVVAEDYNKLQLKAAFNYMFVHDDGSHGMHNFQYAINLLLVSKAALEYGVLTEGFIVDIMDVPNDQGNMVEVTWSRFGGDGISDNPVTNYGVWRLEENEPVKSAATYSDWTSVPELPEIGTSVNDGHVRYVYVGGAPAAQLMQYTALAPTIYNRAPDKDNHGGWEHFVVSGHTRNGVTAWTAPDSGYAVDNLAPAPPADVQSQASETEVTLTWLISDEADFDYYKVYKSETQGFNPDETTLVGTTSGTEFKDNDVTVGNTYYYKLSTVDFNENEGELSEEITVMITGVEQENGVPTEYALQQNYPNPFNPTTTIKYSIPQAADVKLVVYDMLGKEVNVLVNKSQNAGYYNVTWDARDSFGNKLTSGVYIYRIEAGDFVQTSKMILLK